MLLLDEPCARLDPASAVQFEDMICALSDITIVIKTHNMQQAARVSNHTAFFSTVTDRTGCYHGKFIECDDTAKVFTNPRDKQTEDYITGRFG